MTYIIIFTCCPGFLFFKKEFRYFDNPCTLLLIYSALAFTSILHGHRASTVLRVSTFLIIISRCAATRGETYRHTGN